MSTKSSWRPDRKPDSETLLRHFDALDRQIAEIKNQFRRGVLAPCHVQSFIEHRADIFPDAFCTVISRDRDTETLIADLRKRGRDLEGYGSLPGYDSVIRGKDFRITDGVVYHLVGIRANRFGPGVRDGTFDTQNNREAVVAEAARRGYAPLPLEAAALLAEKFTQQELAESGWTMDYWCGHVLIFHDGEPVHDHPRVKMFYPVSELLRSREKGRERDLLQEHHDGVCGDWVVPQDAVYVFGALPA